MAIKNPVLYLMSGSSSQPSVKAVLIGDVAVGKTAISKRLKDNTFDNQYVSTTHSAIVRLTVPDGRGSERDIQLWDTAGDEKYRSVFPAYFRGTHIVICVFDLRLKQSLNHVSDWIKLARDNGPGNLQFLLVGNKSDLDDERQVDFPAAQQLSEQIGARAYIETSALNGTGIDLMRSELGTFVSAVPANSGVVQPVDPDSAPQEGGLGRCLKRC
jgi:small GTP-binding protein